jgi:indole-3-glycerol phosphate synthase
MVLDAILRTKRAEIDTLVVRAERVPPRPGSVVQALLRKDRLRLISEIKHKSPSAGPLSTALSAGDRALAYARAGASMISVLCDREFFGGGWEHLIEARTALDRASLATPLLAKEFILDERQLEQAAACGADAALLIVRIVEYDRLPALVDKARTLGLEPLVEIVNEDELSAAIDAGAKVIGVNARDLDTLGMDATRTARVLAAIPDDVVAVHLSGLKTPADVRRIAETKVDAALIGEALMREDDPTALLKAMVEY